MSKGDGPVKKHKRDSLRVLGTVGEPINPEAWRWYYEVLFQLLLAMCNTLQDLMKQAQQAHACPDCSFRSTGHSLTWKDDTLFWHSQQKDGQSS